MSKKSGGKKIIKKQHPLPSPLLIFRVAHLEILPCLCSVTNPRAQVEENPLFFWDQRGSLLGSDSKIDADHKDGVRRAPRVKSFLEMWIAPGGAGKSEISL